MTCEKGCIRHVNTISGAQSFLGLLYADTPARLGRKPLKQDSSFDSILPFPSASFLILAQSVDLQFRRVLPVGG